MYCSNCGEKVQEGASFCSNCGNRLKKDDISTNNTSQPVTMQSIPGSGTAIASMILGILAIIAGVITFFIAVGLSSYIDRADWYGHFYDSYDSEIMVTAISVIFLPAVLSIIGFCLALGSRSKIKNGANTAGLVLNIITILLCIAQFVMMVG